MCMKYTINPLSNQQVDMTGEDRFAGSIWVVCVIFSTVQTQLLRPQTLKL